MFNIVGFTTKAGRGNADAPRVLATAATHTVALSMLNAAENAVAFVFEECVDANAFDGAMHIGVFWGPTKTVEEMEDLAGTYGFDTFGDLCKKLDNLKELTAAEFFYAIEEFGIHKNIESELVFFYLPKDEQITNETPGYEKRDYVYLFILNLARQFVFCS